jgi:hypothetical protein
MIVFSPLLFLYICLFLLNSFVIYYCNANYYYFEYLDKKLTSFFETKNLFCNHKKFTSQFRRLIFSIDFGTVLVNNVEQVQVHLYSGNKSFYFGQLSIGYRGELHPRWMFDIIQLNIEQRNLKINWNLLFTAVKNWQQKPYLAEFHFNWLPIIPRSRYTYQTQYFQRAVFTHPFVFREIITKIHLELPCIFTESNWKYALWILSIEPSKLSLYKNIYIGNYYTHFVS